jgi:class 3 adenylate cyclase
MRASMSVALALGLGFFVLTAVAGVLSVGLVSGYRNTVDLLRQKAQLLTGAQEAQLVRYLGAAEDQLAYAANLIERGEVVAGPEEDFTSLLLGALAATPQITTIAYIGTSLELTGAERLGNETSPLFAAVAGDLDLMAIVTTARERDGPWWPGLIWREEYGEALLAYALPLWREGEFAGVLIAMVSLQLLSEFVSELESEFGANAFILYGHDHILAHPLMAFGYDGLTRLSPLPELMRFGDPILSSIWEERELGYMERMVLEGPGIHAVAMGGSDYVFIHRPVEGYGTEVLRVGTYFLSGDMLSEVLRFKWAVMFCAVISLLSAVMAAIIGRQIARPVRRLSEGATRIYHLELESVQDIPESFFRELNDAAASFNTMLEGIRWFERYVPKNLVRRLIKFHRDPGLESSFRDVVIMFTDILDFTPLSEGMSAAETAAFLNDHFSLIAASVEREGGTVDKFTGDGVMAVWGAPETYDDLADRACRAAVAIKEKQLRFNEAWAAAGRAPVRVRIGMHIGRVLVGNIGSPMRINYTVVGDAVNVAERLQELGKTLGNVDAQVNILVSGALVEGLSERFELKPLGDQPIRGRREKVAVFALTGQGG